MQHWYTNPAVMLKGVVHGGGYVFAGWVAVTLLSCWRRTSAGPVPPQPSKVPPYTTWLKTFVKKASAPDMTRPSLAAHGQE